MAKRHKIFNMIRRHKSLFGGGAALLVIVIIALGGLTLHQQHNDQRFQAVTVRQMKHREHQDYKSDVRLLTQRGHFAKNNLSGNENAELANKRYERKHHTKKPLYVKYKDGNYWSFFRNHCIMDPSRGPLTSSDTENQDVLKRHGVTTGVNFH